MNNTASELLKIAPGWYRENCFQKKGHEKCCHIRNFEEENGSKPYEMRFVKSVRLEIDSHLIVDMNVHFYMKIEKATKPENITEPFDNTKIEIKKEYGKWFYEGMYINDLSNEIRDNETIIDEFRKKAWENEDDDPFFSEQVYKKLMLLKDANSHFRYAKFLRKKDNKHKKAIDYLIKANEINNEKGKKNWRALYEMALSYSKLDETLKKTLEIMDDVYKAILDIEKYVEKGRRKEEEEIIIKEYFYIMFHYVVLLKKHYGENERMIKKHIEKLDNKEILNSYYGRINPFLERNKKDESAGILIWIDLVDSTAYKKNNDEWYERIVYFLHMTSAIFKNFKYETLKYIGDEIMLFRQFTDDEIDEGEEYQAVKQSYDIFFDKQEWYLKEINRYNPKKYQKIIVKVCMAVVEKVWNVKNLINEEYTFDIFGHEVDMSARLKNLATKDIVVVNNKYKEYLDKNGGEYLEGFNKYTWEGIFKGNDEPIEYYGREINQDEGIPTRKRS